MHRNMTGAPNKFFVHGLILTHTPKPIHAML